MTVIKAENVIKDYDLYGQTVHALRGINLEFKAGEFAAIAGPSGSGKSTFLHLAGCLDTLSGGAMLLGGEDTGKMSGKQLAMNRAEGTTFIFSTHDEMVMDYAGRLVRIRDGQIESDEVKQ